MSRSGPITTKPGFEAALKLAGILEQVGVRELAFAIPHAFIDQGWDAADLEAEGAEITASVHWDAGLGDLRRAARDRFQIEVPETPAPSAPRFELLDVGSMLSRPPEPIRWLLKDSLPLGQVGLLAAQGGTGKSMLLLQLALAVASSSLPSPVKGIFDVAEHGPVLAVFAEDNERMLRGRLWDAYGRFQEPGQGEGIVPAPRASEGQLREGLKLIAGAGLDLRLVHEELGRRDASQVFKDLLDLAASIVGLKLIVLDPLARLFSGQENDNSQATHFCALVELLARETGAAVILAHHTSKASGSDKSKPEERLHQGRGPRRFRVRGRRPLGLVHDQPDPGRIPQPFQGLRLGPRARRLEADEVQLGPARQDRVPAPHRRRDPGPGQGRSSRRRADPRGPWSNCSGNTGA